MSYGRRFKGWFRLPLRAPRTRHSFESPVLVANRCLTAAFSKLSFMFYAPGFSGKLCPRSMEAPVQCMPGSNIGRARGFSYGCGRPDWRNTTAWMVSPGNGKAWMARWVKPRWPLNAPVGIRPIGEKKGRKRSLLTDGNGIPLSLVVAGANEHDSKLLASTLDSIVVERPTPSDIEQHLCADAGYKGKPCMEVTLERGYKPHIKQRREEAAEIKTVPGAKARRWVVERTHSWLNRWRKLLVSFEKSEKSYFGLLSLAAALICWRQTIAIYG